jgi:HEAT repeat protein
VSAPAATAAEQPGRVRGPRGRDPLARLRGARKPAQRAGGAAALAQLDTPEATAALSDALADPAPEVREAAAMSLASLRDPDSIPALTAVVAGWTNPAQERARRAALRALVAFRSERAALELVRALVDAGPGRPLDLADRSALLAVVHAEPTGVAVPHVVRTLVSLLGHEDAAAGARAVTLLMLFPAEAARPLARTLRTGTATAVRRRAAEALRACRQDEAVSALVSALADPAADVRAAAARSLGEMRDPAAVAALHGVAGDSDRKVRDAARAALSALGRGATTSGMAAGLGSVESRTA